MMNPREGMHKNRTYGANYSYLHNVSNYSRGKSKCKN